MSLSLSAAEDASGAEATEDDICADLSSVDDWLLLTESVVLIGFGTYSRMRNHKKID